MALSMATHVKCQHEVLQGKINSSSLDPLPCLWSSLTDGRTTTEILDVVTSAPLTRTPALTAASSSAVAAAAAATEAGGDQKYNALAALLGNRPKCVKLRVRFNGNASISVQIAKSTKFSEVLLLCPSLRLVCVWLLMAHIKSNMSRCLLRGIEPFYFLLYQFFPRFLRFHPSFLRHFC